MSERIPDSSPSLLTNRKVTTLLIVALLVSIVTIGYVSATSSSVHTEQFPFVDSGDMVYVNYIGYFPTHPGGWIFDSNIRAVGEDTNLMKSLYFQKREASQYTPLNFTAGTATNFLKAFVEGVVGMQVTQTKDIYIPAEEGYPLVIPDIATYPLVLIAPVIQNITVSEFQSVYGLLPVAGLLVKHYFWGWNTSVKAVLGDKVVLQSQPTLGEIISSYGDPASDPRDGWYQEVISINASANNGLGIIKVQNLITPQDIFQKKGKDFDKKQFTLLEVNETSQEFSVIYNDTNYVGELAGRPLLFEVTVTKVIKP